MLLMGFWGAKEIIPDFGDIGPPGIHSDLCVQPYLGDLCKWCPPSRATGRAGGAPDGKTSCKPDFVFPDRVGASVGMFVGGSETNSTGLDFLK